MTFGATDPQQIYNALQEPLVLLDSERDILFMNAAAIGVFAVDYTGRNIVRLVRHPEVIQLITEVLAGKSEGTVKVTLENPLRGVFSFRITRLEQIEETSPVLAVSVRDLTDLAIAEQMRSDFVANVSHELRSPLTALSGFIETMKGPAKNDASARERFLTLMEREASRMVNLISDLLSLSKVEAKQHQRPTEPVDMGDLTRRAVTTLSGRAAKEGKRLTLTIEGEPKPVPAFEDQMMQVVINLVENAIKYGAPDSEISVRINTSPHVAGFNGEVLSISVEDHGEGIAREHLPRLTERFYRVDTHRSRDKGGTGLGLAIVKHIINQHRGRLQISSIEGKGSIFTVHLPYRG